MRFVVDCCKYPLNCSLIVPLRTIQKSHSVAETTISTPRAEPKRHCDIDDELHLLNPSFPTQLNPSTSHLHNSATSSNSSSMSHANHWTSYYLLAISTIKESYPIKLFLFIIHSYLNHSTSFKHNWIVIEILFSVLFLRKIIARHWNSFHLLFFFKIWNKLLWTTIN